jgi:hypothetical protein
MYVHVRVQDVKKERKRVWFVRVMAKKDPIAEVSG